MSRKNKVLGAALLGAGFLLIAAIYLSQASIPVLQPAGIIAQKERNLIYISLLLAVVVVLPVFVTLFLFAWKYREGNEKAKYSPHFESSKKLESIWWGVPFAIIFILSIITWNSSHDLDPFKPLNAAGQPLKVQVIALQWKWLFIYPDSRIASVNFFQMPVGTPVDFEITSDAPMNSFWIPQLGGQIYAMPGMSTHLHLMADKEGDYNGKSANISGKGFARMTFTARASSQHEFDQWAARISKSKTSLNMEAYNKLAEPGTIDHVLYYSGVDNELYNTVVSKYMSPNPGPSHEHGMEM